MKQLNMKKIKEIYNNVLSALKRRLTQLLAGRLKKTGNTLRRYYKSLYIIKYYFKNWFYIVFKRLIKKYYFMNYAKNNLIWISKTFDIVYNETIIAVLDVNFKNAEEKIFSDRKLIFTLMPTLALGSFKNIIINDKYFPNKTENYEDENQIIESGLEMLNSLISNYVNYSNDIIINLRTSIDRLVIPTKKCNYELIISKNFQTKIKYASIMSIGLTKQYQIDIDDEYVFEDIFNLVYNL